MAGDRERDRAAGEDKAEVREAVAEGAAAEVRELAAGWAVAPGREAVAAGWAASLPEWAATASVRAVAKPRAISEARPVQT